MEKEFNEEDALKTIRQSIEHTKDSFREKGFLYLIFGWGVFVASVADLFSTGPIRHGSYSWGALLLAMLFLSAYHWVQEPNAYSSILIPDINKSALYHLWKAFAATLVVMLMFHTKTDSSPSLEFPTTIALIGLVAYTSGGILKFKPLLIGGGISLGLLAVLAWRYNNEYQSLFLAASVLCSFIIPGHILRARK